MDLKDLVTFTSEGDSQLKNSHESLTKCSDRQHNPVNIRLVQIEIPAAWNCCSEGTTGLMALYSSCLNFIMHCNIK